jgi:uncharacterized protein
MRTGPKPVVHLELHTRDLASACGFYALLCGWRPERVRVDGASYVAFATGGGVGGGIVECETARDVWLPYVEVCDVAEVTERARLAGASVLLETREGPVGRRSVVAAPGGAEIALWQPRERKR